MKLDSVATAIRELKEVNSATDHLRREADLRNANALGLSRELALKVEAATRDEISEETRQRVGDTIKECMLGNNFKELDELVKIRILFEASSAYKNISSTEKTDELLERLTEANQAIVRLIEAAEAEQAFDTTAANGVWEHDRRFHYDLCCFAEPNSSFAELVIDTIRDVCQKVGRCASLREAYLTLDEHNEIIEAVRARHYDRIFEATKTHVRNACSRWRMRLKDQWLASYLTPAPVFCSSEKAFFEWLSPANVKSHSGRWVTFSDTGLLSIDKTKAAAIENLEKQGYTVATCYTRLVTPELLGHDAFTEDE